MKNYILIDKVVTECSMEDWLEFMEDPKNKMVKRTTFKDNIIYISTVFLGIDHAFYRDSGSPVLFETMIFGGLHDDYQERYSTWDEAITGHDEAIKTVLNTNPKLIEA